MPDQSSGIKALLGFPYPAQYEEGFRRQQVKTMYRPLLGAVMFVLLFTIALLVTLQFSPELLAPPECIKELNIIHLCFLGFTLLVFCLAVMLRRQLLKSPTLYFTLCNSYAVGICIWSSTLAANVSYPDVVFTAYIYVCICVALVTLLKPWQALILFPCNYLLFLVLHCFVLSAGRVDPSNVANAGFAAILGIVISVIFYRFRSRTYYSRTIIIQQMEEINTINAKLQALVHIDTLTGLFNRRFFDEALPDKLDKMLENYAVVYGMMIDVDFFKDYNDRYGHQTGDNCLRHIAGLMQKQFDAQQPAFAIRYGGEEFFVLAGAQTMQEAIQAAETLLGAVSDSYVEHLSHPLGHVTISVGLAACDKTAPQSLAQLTQRADSALYAAKEAGRNRMAIQ